MSFMDFSSWPRDQEQQFVVFEQRTSESSKKAMTIGIIVSAIVFVVAIGIYAGVPTDYKDPAASMNMSNLTKKAAKPAPAPSAEAPAPAPAPTAAPAPAPAPAPAAAPADKPAAPPADKK
jgi:hypothetical protein